MSEARDPNGNHTTFDYTPARQLWKITDASNRVTEYAYYPDGLLASITDPESKVVSFSYDDLGQLEEVTYPEVNVQFDDGQTVFTPKLRMAYDVWGRLAAATSPNGNLDDLAHINLLGALNVLRNGNAASENGSLNQVPRGWREDRPSGFVNNTARVQNGDQYYLPLNVPDSLDTDESHDWVQSRPAGGVGGRYLMKGTGYSDLETNFRLRAVVRDFAGSLAEQSAQRALSAEEEADLSGRLDLPGDAQTSPRMPVLHQFRAGMVKPDSGTAYAEVSNLQVLALSQLSLYQGEYAAGSLSPDGARSQVVRDRFGRVKRVIDPIHRKVEFSYDAMDRILSVTDSQGLTLQYEWDFLGNLVKFTDSLDQETTFEYDDLNRVTKITQPDTGQFEQFAYTAGGDLSSYANCREQERQFFYDNAHRLTRIDYLLDPSGTESVLMEYDSAGNLRKLTERNGDYTVMHYDNLNRLERVFRASAEHPAWSLKNRFDSRGNRDLLTSREGVYGQNVYGADPYGGTETNIFQAHFDDLNRMDSLIDSQSNETRFKYDSDSRLRQVDHPLETMHTQYRHDLVGKLLEVSLDNEGPLWKLNYEYNLAGERLRQTSCWEDGGNCFEYALDASGRLIRETINRWVVDRPEDWASGRNTQTAFDLDGKLRMLARSDDFSGNAIDLQRWEIVISEPAATAVQIRQNDGLRMVTSAGETRRNGRHMPPGTPIESSNAGDDYPHLGEIQVSDTVGWFEGRILLRHRLPLTAEFDLAVSIADFDLHQCSIGLGVTRERFQMGNGESRFPTDLGGVMNADGCDLVVENDDGLIARFNDNELGDVTVSRLRLKRVVEDDVWTLTAYYHDGEDWVSDPSWEAEVDDQQMFAYLHLSGKVGYLRWSDFQDTVGDPYPTAGEYESRVYDAGRSVDWTRISWNEVCPSGTDVEFQVAVSEDADGPWSYGSALTTAAATTITSTTGRYAKFKVSMTSDGSDTPVVNDVQITHDGTSGSRVTRWSYDDAGNITEQARVTDAGTETDEREYNDLNQLTASSGGWTYQHDEDGNLIGKDNGELEGCEKWEFAWSDECRLMQVKKGVYDATPTLVNEFTVDYSYDQMGRLLTRDDGTDVTTYFWDQFDLFRETTGESVTEYVVSDGMIRGFLRDGELCTLHCDGLNSVRSVTDSEGSVVAQMDFSAWGQALSGSVDLVPGGLPMGFVGGLGVRRDALTGLFYMRQRWYDGAVGRFISRDPIGLGAGSNLYSYCANNPVNAIDPSGLDPYSYSEELRFSDALGILNSMRGPDNYGDVARQSQADRASGKIRLASDAELEGLLAATRTKINSMPLVGTTSTERVDIMLSKAAIDGSEYISKIHDARDYRYGSALLLAVALLKENYHFRKAEYVKPLWPKLGRN